MVAKLIAQQLRDKLKKYEDFQGLYVYGSRINGNASYSRDFDIVAIFKKQYDYNQDKKICMDVLELELENDIVIDFKNLTLDELNSNYIYFNEINKGIYYGT